MGHDIQPHFVPVPAYFPVMPTKMMVLNINSHSGRSS
jgi:hypothetical protein